MLSAVTNTAVQETIPAFSYCELIGIQTSEFYIK